jgi:YVTN family beta-propeller protein
MLLVLVISLELAPASFGVGAPSTTAMIREPLGDTTPAIPAPASSVISPLTPRSPLIASIPVGGNPSGAAFDSASDTVYVPTSSSDNVSIISGTSVVGSVPVGVSPSAAAFDSADGFVYVADGGMHTHVPVPDFVTVINGSSLVATIPVGTDPQGVTYDSSNGFVYVSNYDPSSDNLTVINGTSVIASIPVGESPAGGAFDSANGYVYVTNRYSDNVSVINGTSVVASIPLAQDDEPTAAAYDPEDGYVYVTNIHSGSISVIDGTTVVGTIQLPEFASTYGATYDSANGYVYVSNASSNGSGGNVLVINGTAIITLISINSGVFSGAFDRADGDVYFGGGSDNVFVIDGSFHYPSISSFEATPSTVEMVSRTIPSTTLAVLAEGGEGPLTFTYMGLPPGCTTSNTSSLVCTPTSPGTFNVRIYVNDSAGNSANSTTTLNVVPALSASAMATPAQIDAGVAVNFASNPMGGIGPNSYAWEFGDGSSSTAQNPSHSYASSGNYTAQVWVNDSGGGSVHQTLSVSVDLTLTVALTVSNSTPVLGQTIAINATAAGGAGPYTYSYLGLPPGCVTTDSPTIGCFPTQAGFYNLSVAVTDHNGVTANASIAIQIIFDFTVVVPSRTTVGQPFTLSVKPDVGYGTITYAYAGLPPGCASVDARQLTCTPTQVGNYNISITVQDQAGDHATHLIKLAVVPASSSTLGSPLLLEGAVVAVAIAVAVIAIALIVSRGRRTESTSDAYAAYRIAPPSGVPGASATRQGPSRPASTSASPESNAAGEDSLSDLV